ncbi:hypothetical protein GEMRC1_005220 [Eukaryota sp. GEM-RC1]
MATSLKDFTTLIKGIADSRFKQDEERIMKTEILTLKRVMTTGDMTPKKASELVLRVAYAEMLGYDASFGYIHAVNLTQSPSLIHKRLGYLVCSLCLHPDHDLLVLLVNSLQRDLKSKNPLVIAFALAAACRLLPAEMIPAVIDLVANLIDHKLPLVRKRPSPVSTPSWNVFPSALADKSPSVIGVAVLALCTLSKDAPDLYRFTVPSLVSLLRQVSDDLFPVGYSYRKFPHPWMQTHVLRCLSNLSLDDPETAEEVAGVVTEVLIKRQTTSNIGAAITFEAVMTASRILANFDEEEFSDGIVGLYNILSEVVTEFLQADPPNFKYIGVQMLSCLVKKTPSIALMHQVSVLNCLDSVDETIHTTTLELMYKMANEENVDVIIDRFLSYLNDFGSMNTKKRSSLVSKVLSLAEQFSSSIDWFVEKIVELFIASDGDVPEHVTVNLTSLLMNSDLDQMTADVIVDLFINTDSNCPLTIVNLCAFILGQYCSLQKAKSALALLESFIRKSISSSDPAIFLLRSTIVNSCILASLKLISKHGSSLLLPSLSDVISDISMGIHSTLINVTAKQSALEFVRLTGSLSDILGEFFFEMTQDVDFETALSQLVDTDLKHGGTDYQQPEDRIDYTRRESLITMGVKPASSAVSHNTLRFDAYDEPEMNLSRSPEPLPVIDNFSSQPKPPVKEESKEVKLVDSNINRKWGKGGLIKKQIHHEEPVFEEKETKEEVKDMKGLESNNTHHIQEAPSSVKFSARQRESLVKDQALSQEKQQLASALFGRPKKKVKSGSEGVAVTPVEPSAVNELDLLGDLGDLSSTPSSSTKRAGDFDLLSGYMEEPASSVTPRLEFLESAGVVDYQNDCTSLASDNVIDVWFVDVISGPQKGKLIKITNKHSTPLVPCQLGPLNGFSLLFDSQKASFNGSKLTFKSIPPRESVYFFICPRDLSVVGNVNALKAVYKCYGDVTPATVNLKISFDFSTILIKEKLTTPQFGKMWPSIRNVHKISVDFNDTNPHKWLQYLESKTGVAAIDVSGAEAISSSKLNLEEEVLFLVHTKLTGSKAIVAIKSSDTRVPTFVGDCLKKLMDL